MNSLHVMTMAGSLRARSYNGLLLDAAAHLSPPGLTLSRYNDLAAVPLFNEDVEALGLPPGVQALQRAVGAADGLLLATPEYNQSIPGVLKNAIDWLSRPACEGVLEGKVVGIVGVTAGQWGTRLAQAALRHVLFATESIVLPGPGLFLREAQRLFSPDGKLQDESAREALRRYLTAFASTLQASSIRKAVGSTA